MSYLIDTDIIIYSFNDHQKVHENLILHRNSLKALSVISYGELIYGARKSKNLEKNLAKIYRLAEIFPIIEISPAIMESFGELKASLEKAAMPLADMDLQIAATALVHNLTLVSNNEKHFARINGLRIENWTN